MHKFSPAYPCHLIVPTTQRFARNPALPTPISPHLSIFQNMLYHIAQAVLFLAIAFSFVGVAVTCWVEGVGKY
jgi:hypothetical protein